MDWLAALIHPFLQWLWQTTLIASLVICLILVVQKSLGHKLGPRWSHALWLVLLIRMVVPWAPQSRISLLNLLPSSVRQAQLPPMSNLAKQGLDSHLAGSSEAVKAKTEQQAASGQPTREAMSARPQTHAKAQEPPRPAFPTLRQILPMLWLAGAALVGVHLFACNFALWRIVKREHPLVDQSTLELFEECKVQMGVQTLVAAVPSGQTGSPALFGFLRPRLLLPRQMLDAASRDEMRYVFLHELAHLKRHDIYLGWVTSLLQVLHWFNPLVWFAFHRMRLDRELACDALVLARTGEQESQEYGRAIVALLQRLSRSRPLPAMAGILENKSQLKRRIAMIAQFRNNSYRWSPPAVALIVALGCVSLPNARPGMGAQSTSASGSGEQPAGTPAGENNVLIDPKTGITFRKVKAFVGTDAVDDYFRLQISPNGKFLLEEAGLSISPLDGGKPFKLVDMSWPTDGCWSPDGRKIAFRSGNPNSLAIWVVRVDPDTAKPTGPPKRLVEGAGGMARWLPDSERVTFSRFDGQTPSLWSVSINDGTLTQITDLSSVGIPSPDGENIVYSEDPIGLNKPIWVKSTTGGSSRRLDDGGYPDSWSADGKWVHRWGWARFLRITDGRQVDIEVPTEVGRPVDLPALAGRKMYFCRSAYDYRRLFKVVSVLGGPGSEPGMGMAIHNWEGFPTWWPDSQAIIVHGTKGNDGNLWALPLTAGQPIPFKADAFAIGSESRFSPDLKNLLGVIRTSYDPNSELDVFDVCVLPVSWREMCATGPAVPIFKALKSGTVGLPAVWSPDGKKIAVADIGSIHVVPATGGEPVQLANDSKVIDWLDWSPDGKTIAFHQMDTEGIRVVSSSGGEVRTVCSMASWRHVRQRSLCWSPDGQAFVMAIRNHAIVSVSIADGSTRPLVTLSDLGKNDAQQLCFSPDGKCLAFVAEKPPHDGPLFVLHIEGGKVDQLTGEESPSGLRWSPDGKWISYYTPQKPFKTRAESVVWEMDVEEALTKLVK